MAKYEFLIRVFLKQFRKTDIIEAAILNPKDLVIATTTHTLQIFDN
jgi:hypothetical protein